MATGRSSAASASVSSAWGGMGHASQCRTVINPDGSVSIEIGTQDLGTGTRTIITQVAAETLGLQMGQVKLVIGNNDLPPDGGSGGSTTVGGVSTSTRKSTMNALAKLFEAVGAVARRAAGSARSGRRQHPREGQPEQEPHVGGRLQEARHEQDLRNGDVQRPRRRQPADAGRRRARRSRTFRWTPRPASSRSTATSRCRIAAWSSIRGSPRARCTARIIMGIGTALFEERIIDDQTGRTLNPDMEWYKLAGIADIGNIVVHMDIRKENDNRGVIGLGEPSARSRSARRLAMRSPMPSASGCRIFR